jgi:hypothetical protein
LVVLSLFVSSISACACHHDSIQAVGEHCQPKLQHSHEAENSSQHPRGEAIEQQHHANLTEAENDSISFSENGCCCIKPAPKVFAKSETVKSEKQMAKLSLSAQIEINLTAQIVSVKTAEFIRPFYLSDSFYNISPGRAPPRL